MSRTIGNGLILYATSAGFACQSFQTCSQDQFIPSVSLWQPFYQSCLRG